MKAKYCSFPVTVTKAWVDPTTNKKRISGVASDDKLDHYRERFAIEALNDMVRDSKAKKPLKPEEGLVDLLETHRETFGFGYVVDGRLERNMELNSTEYHFEGELKDGWPQGEELWEDIRTKRVDKQLSVGGWIPDWDKDYEIVNDTFVDDDGNEIQVSVGVIKRFKLEHIATTPPDGAANPRTRFETAKDKGYQHGYIYKSAMDSELQKRFVEDDKGNFLTNMKSLFKEVMLEVFGEREDKGMDRVEKAKAQVDELRKFIEENKGDFTEEVMKSLGISFVTEDTETPPESVSKEEFDEFTTSVETSIEEVRKAIPTMPEIPEVPKVEDIVTEVRKALEEELAKFEGIEARLKAIEEKAPDGHDEPDQREKDNQDDDVEDSDNSNDEVPEELRVWM